MRVATTSVLVVALTLDALLGTARTGTPSAPVITLSAVAGIGLAVSGRTGAIAGFGAGVVLDLLAGPASPGGVHALVGLAVGAVAGVVRPPVLGPVGGGAAVGGSAAGIGTAATLALQGLAASASVFPVDAVVVGVVAGALACPMVVRFLGGALPEPTRTA